MGVGRENKGALAPLHFEFSLPKKVVFLVLRGENQISSFLAPLEKFRKNPLVVDPLKKSF